MSKSWDSNIEKARHVQNASDIDWDAKADIVVIGLGAAGVACALESLESGHSVIALDRFSGGGATMASGGVIYAGGGTSIQKAARIIDTPDNMFNYLKQEVGEIISDKTLRDFCLESAPTIDWMAGHGVNFRSNYWPKKTSYPAPEYFLYHSDNSLLTSHQKNCTPAARGHRGFVPIKQGRKAQNLGGSFFTPLRHKAETLGLHVDKFTEARQLILNRSGEVIGVKALRFKTRSTERRYKNLRRKAQCLMTIYPPILPGFSFFMKRARKVLAQSKKLEDQRVEYYIRAEKAVLLSAGGFIFNRKMLKTYAPKYEHSFPLGTDGDSGAGIRLGQTAGGAIGNMDRVTAWRFINPPLSFARGIIVNSRGKRFINEMVYGATLGVEIAENHNGKAWLILDRPLIKSALDDVSGKKALPFQKALTKLNIYFGSIKAKTIGDLAKKTGLNSSTLKRTIDDYNESDTDPKSDPFGKDQSDIFALRKPPFYAINIGLDAKLFPCPALTLGGLKVDESSGEVIDENDKPVSRLYAAGRNAIGVASWNYVSGLSIADGIYSGRRVARAISKLTPSE